MKQLMITIFLACSTAWSQDLPTVPTPPQTDYTEQTANTEKITETPEALLSQQVSVPQKASEESSFRFSGALNFNLQNWSRVGATGDSKMGFGFGVDFGVSYTIDDLKVIAGPHLGYNRWSADYSQKSQSITDSVYVEMADAGVGLALDWGDMYVNMGSGSSTLTSGMMVGGKDIKYNFSGSEYSYTMAGVGFRMDQFIFGLNTVNYSGFAKSADRIEFLLGYRL